MIDVERMVVTEARERAAEALAEAPPEWIEQRQSVIDTLDDRLVLLDLDEHLDVFADLIED